MFGIGNINPPGDIRTAGMGNTGIALPSNNGLNSTNPASFTTLDSLTFYMNMQVQGLYTNFNSANKSQNSFDINFDQFSFGFKGASWWGCSVGLSPYSSVGYNITSPNDLIGTAYEYDVKYQGSGGLSRIYIDNAFRLFKGFSVGANVSYLWGNITRTETSYFDQINGETIINEKKYTAGNIMVEGGFQYGFNIGKKHTFYTGATYSPATKLSTNYAQSIESDGGTSYYTEEKDAVPYEIPMRYGAGIGYSFNKIFTLGMDYKYENWENVSTPVNYAQLNDSKLYSIGAEYAPNKNMYASLFNRMKYRAGFSAGDTYLTIADKNIKQIGFSAGLGIPLKQFRNYVNISYQYNHIGSSTGNMVEENQHTIKLGILLCETWFFKSKFE